ncbi:galectin-16-like [Marmota marmota marmota]|uniref:galectin-16-like n=1 Tax=Marmota marmota marmota TaxID=9994 RepID=UPI0020929D97|nr:galectin-16-like [Marmota marmota marmota]
MDPNWSHTHKNVNLSVGSSVTIRGIVSNTFRKDPQLQVDFHTDRDPTSDIAFHVRVYFGHSVVLNSLQDGGWRTEVTSHKMPFQENQPFKLRFLVLNNEYQVVLNDEHFYSFIHRVPPSSVKMVEVWRDVLLYSMEVS